MVVGFWAIKMLAFASLSKGNNYPEIMYRQDKEVSANLDVDINEERKGEGRRQGEKEKEQPRSRLSTVESIKKD